MGKFYSGQFLVGLADNPEMKSHNYGDILYDANSTAEVYAGGDIGVVCHNLSAGVESATTANRTAFFTNHGDITINGYCKSAQIGGFCGRVQGGSAAGVGTSKFYHTVYDSYNKGNMTINATVDGGDCAIGGLYGFLINNFSGAGGNWVNEGKLTFTGEVKTHRLLVGGFIGATDRAFSGNNSAVYNFGDIECSGTVNTSKGNRVGGLLGQTNTSFANFHVYCNIRAIGFQNHNVCGILTGSPRGGKVVSSNCSAGGSICYENENDYNADGDLIGTKDKPIYLTLENYFNYLYGKKVDWATIENIEPYDGCTFLSAKPTL